MKSDHKEFSLKDCVKRIDHILQSDDSFIDLDAIPSRNTLTYTNGFYVKCSVLHVDLRFGSDLADFSGGKGGLKLYRTCVSEVTAVMNGCRQCAEISVVGDHVSAVFDTPWTEDVDEVFTTAAKISSVVGMINSKFKKNGFEELKIGVGLSYGKALVVKTGTKGSSVDEVIWLGDVVKEAATLAGYGNREPQDRETMVSELFYYNLSDQNKKLLAPNAARGCYHGDVVNQYITNWYKQNSH